MSKIGRRKYHIACWRRGRCDLWAKAKKAGVTHWGATRLLDVFWENSWFRGRISGHGFRSDDKFVFGRYRHDINSIEAFRQCWRLQFPEGACDSWYRNLLFSFAQIISPNCVTQGCGEKVCHHAKASCSSRLNISCTIAWQWICVVDDKRFFASQASCEQKLFSMPCPQHVETDANMGIEKMLAVEGSLTGTLNPNENYRFHRTLQPRRVRTLKGAPCDFWQLAWPGAVTHRSGHSYIRELDPFAHASQQ